MNTTKHKIPFVFSVFTSVMLMGGLNGCTSSEGNTSEKNTDGPAVPTGELVSIKKGVLASSLSMPGELISFQHVDLYARENSFVKSIHADVGSEVRAGQVLASLEAPEIASRLAGAESRWKSSEALYTASKASYERLLETSKTPGTISPNDLDQARAKMNSDLAQLEAARAAHKEVRNTLDYLTIKAPFDGVITARNVDPGAYVGPSGRGSERPLFTLQEQKKLRLVVSVPEAYTAYLKQGDEINFSTKALPDTRFKANVARMAGALDTRLRAQRVEMDVVNKDRKLLAGMVAQVTIPLLNRDSAFIVPRTAIVNSQEKVSVIKVINDTARWVDVQTGRSIDGKTEVYGPLRTGERIVKIAGEEVRDGAPFREKSGGRSQK